MKLLGRESRNGRTYAESAMKDAERLYDNVAVSRGSSPRSTPNAERSEDRIGVVKNVKREVGACTATFT